MFQELKDILIKKTIHTILLPKAKLILIAPVSAQDLLNCPFSETDD